MNIWERVAADQARGELWKARDRLTGAVANQGADQAILDALAKVHLAMHDLPAAGQCWFLTNRNDDDAVEARSAFANRYGNGPWAMLNALHIKAPVASYPPVVQDRLNALIDQTAKRGYRWVEPSLRPRTRTYETVPPHVQTPLSKVGEGLVIAAVVGIWLIGFGAIVALIIYGIMRVF